LPGWRKVGRVNRGDTKLVAHRPATVAEGAIDLGLKVGLLIGVVGIAVEDAGPHAHAVGAGHGFRDDLESEPGRPVVDGGAVREHPEWRGKSSIRAGESEERRHRAGRPQQVEQSRKIGGGDDAVLVGIPVWTRGIELREDLSG